MNNKLVCIAGAGLVAGIIVIFSIYVSFTLPTKDASEKKIGKDPVNYTVEHFKKNEQARDNMLKSCEVTDAAHLEANCLNAAQAANDIRRERDAAERKKLYGQ